MLYMPALGHDVYMYCIAPGVYRVVVGDLCTDSPCEWVDEAFAVLFEDNRG